MLKQTLSITRNNLAFYAMFIGCSAGIAIFDQYSGKSTTGGVILFLTCLLSMNVQNSVLRNLNFTAAAKVAKLPTGGYVFRTLALSLLTLCLMAIPVIFLVGASNIDRAYLGLLAVLIFLVALTIVFSLLGTWLPARIHGTNAGIGDALRRGVARFPSTVLLVFLGLALPLVAGIILMLIASTLSGTDPLASGHVNIPLVASSLISNALQALGWTYISVLLTRRYMEAEHIAPASQELMKVFT
ncbi:hypothetical protein HGP17_26115 [Rhizobium sp. P38BS-XIX]|uniref:hypothetical protein n=1 Tax=Rhizobium sp. P38BS-XIX TaxID=2726740 RepID=UPI001456D4D2|nr:hypothetical protein [Rhizobium sp. P38BS-XIX]NLS00318.1 hypothetical protein [Rhizobium sp. P38BS-XIX]